MNIGTIDAEKRIRISGTKPKQRFLVIQEPDGYRLKLVTEPKKMTKEEVLRALRTSKLKFARSWDEMRKDTREP